MDYDSKYSKEEFYWGLKPNKIVVESIKHLLQGAKILDLGCGEGKDAFFLAKNNFDVIAVDLSKEGIKKLSTLAKKERLKIKTSISDINSYLQGNEFFDAILAINVIQFISAKNIFNAIKKIHSATNQGGLNIITSFIAETPQQKEIALTKGMYFFDTEELREIYKGWEILFYREKLGNWETHGEPRHRHFIVEIIAKKI